MEDKIERLELAKKVLEYLRKEGSAKAIHIGEVLEEDKSDINSVLYSELRNEVQQDEKFYWSSKNSEGMNLETQVIKFLNQHNKVKAIEIADHFNVSRKEVNSLLYGKLKNKCAKNDNHEWSLI